MVTVCTTIGPDAFPAAEVLAASLRQHLPNARLLAQTWPEGIDIDGWDDVIRSQTPLPTPDLLRRALDGSVAALFLASEMRVYGPLAPVWEALRSSEVALFRRVQSFPDDDESPSDAELLAAGMITPRAIGVAASGDAEAVLNWWSQRIAESATDGRPLPDRPWLDLAIDRFPSVRELPDAGCNVSYWNLHERRLSHGASGEVLVDGVPLSFFDFEGFRPDRPYWLSDRATRVLVMDDPVLVELCGALGAELIDSGWTEVRPGIDDLERLGNGQRIDHLVRGLWRSAQRDGEVFGDPLHPACADLFVAWLKGPAARGASDGVNRYLLAAYATRPDLQQAFPDLDGADGVRLVEWAWVHGRREIIGELLPRAPEQVPAQAGTGLGVNVIGYLGETLGLAEAARLYVVGLGAAGVPVSTTAVMPDLPVEGPDGAIERYGSRQYEDTAAPDEPSFNLACVNGDHLVQLIKREGTTVLSGRPTIGQWGWETDLLPPSWTPAFEYVDEVWVYSRFVAENLGRLLPVPVVVVPPPIVVPDVDRDGLEIARDDRFTFLFMLDMFSTLQRKNPLGLIDAFKRAFEPDEGPRLIIKTINGRFRVPAAQSLRHRAAGRSDIEFIDGYLEPAQRAALVERANCYVSLHRSEGFGLTLAEAMALGTPVIATGYSGNMDFMSESNSYLVDWKPTFVGPDCEVYPPNGKWAEPDLDHAAKLIRRVWEDPGEAMSRAQRARSDVRRSYAPEVVGGIARGRLEQLSDLRASSVGASSEVEPTASIAAHALARVEEALAFDIRSGASPVPRGIKGMVRTRVLRLMLPYTHHQRDLDRRLFLAVRELQAELENLNSALRRREDEREPRSGR